MEIFTSLLASAADESIRAIIKGISKKIGYTKDPVKAAILRELRENLKVLSHRDKMGITRQDLINELSNEAVSAADKMDYDFRKLRRRRPHKLTEKMFPKSTNKFLGWTAKEMVLGIDSKIYDLQFLSKKYNVNDRTISEINITARLNNLNYQIYSFLTFINYK